MLIALTGTPGTGKTSAAKILRSKGYRVHEVAELAKRFGAMEMSNDGGMGVDVERLASRLQGMSLEGAMIVVGHLSHFLAPNLCIVLRCSPAELRRRLTVRGYPERKIRMNLEAEAIDLILVEALECCEKVREIDATPLTPAEVADRVEEIVHGKSRGYLPGAVDWSEEVLSWY
ncbi:MAG: adenylate kinase family protein [Candidatus Thermoplasmatota archaeon]